MPSTIPFDPSLVLGNVVHEKRIDTLKKIADAQKNVDSLRDKLNSLILQRRSLDMTLQELMNLGVNAVVKDDGTIDDSQGIGKLIAQIDQINEALASTAAQLGEEVISSENKIAAIHAESEELQIHSDVESPIDYNKSAIKKMPLSTDSLKLDAQYFSMESNDENGSNHSSSVAAYVAGQVSSVFGPTIAAKAGASTNDVVSKQATNHKIEGTLVITANCTHKQIDVFAPFVLDVDKGIRAWNDLHKDEKAKQIDMDKKESVLSIATSDEANQNGMSLLSGATYGSSFVGMVHILRKDSTESSQSASSKAASLETQIEMGSWFAKKSGKFGIEASVADSVKSLLSTANVSSHCSLISMGLIPTIKSNEIVTVVKSLKLDPQQSMEQLAQIQGATNSNLNTLATASEGATDGQQMLELDTNYLKAAVNSVGELDAQKNQVLDTNSMMTALDDYIQKAIAGDCGIPINFYIKPITQKQLAKAWVNKYYPDEFRGANSGDDNSQGTKKEDKG